jgi:capsule polysaccharide export protein KpsE/RkpR
MVKTPPSPLNFLMCREHYQISRYRLLRCEEQLMTALACKTVADLEMAMLQEQAKPNSEHKAQIAEYHRLHRDLDAADRLYEAATDLQRKRVADADAAQKELARTFATIEC